MKKKVTVMQIQLRGMRWRKIMLWTSSYRMTLWFYTRSTSTQFPFEEQGREPRKGVDKKSAKLWELKECEITKFFESIQLSNHSVGAWWQDKTAQIITGITSELDRESHWAWDKRGPYLFAFGKEYL